MLSLVANYLQRKPITPTTFFHHSVNVLKAWQITKTHSQNTHINISCYQIVLGQHAEEFRTIMAGESLSKVCLI
jgi:hypothetical protein